VARAVLQTPISIDFKILAVVSTLKDFRLCWLLNKELHLNLERQAHDLIPPGRQARFSIFSFPDELDKTVYHLISNHNGSEILIPELKAHDYFLMVKGPCPGDRLEALEGTLRSINNVHAVFRIEPSSLASVQNFIFDDAEF
jgi:hypothetical protein